MTLRVGVTLRRSMFLGVIRRGRSGRTQVEEIGSSLEDVCMRTGKVGNNRISGMVCFTYVNVPMCLYAAGRISTRLG